MPKHVHFFFRTSEANLSRGMQRLLSGYANWYAKKHQQSGHLFQGRFKGELALPWDDAAKIAIERMAARASAELGWCPKAGLVLSKVRSVSEERRIHRWFSSLTLRVSMAAEDSPTQL